MGGPRDAACTSSLSLKQSDHSFSHYDYYGSGAHTSGAQSLFLALRSGDMSGCAKISLAQARALRACTAPHLTHTGGHLCKPGAAEPAFSYKHDTRGLVRTELHCTLHLSSGSVEQTLF